MLLRKIILIGKIRSIPRTAWTTDEINSLRKYFPSYPKKVVLKNLPNRSWTAIERKASKLGISRSRTSYIEYNKVLNLVESKKIWLACALDFEGTIGLLNNTKSHKKRGYNYFNPYISFSNTNKEVVVNFKNLLTNEKYPKIEIKKRKATYKPCYAFRTTKQHLIYELLKALVPYLIIKKKQAILLINFIEDNIKNRRIKKYKHTKKQCDIYNELKSLNKRGI